ncbi:hypothetical protein J0656_11715 [Muricauda ruestringensis]|uniref:Glycosyl hydrolase 36 catalytic domain-containing protein n=1 Tax=Flagellimonas aurea TaxID=2915619 RepID=A0ABS3G6Y7_9FLAO|nr:hypothetical protein [Allomuricauda aurea]MAO15279.1 hypothetical protein [Allomuricauda sp.]MBO0354683.1 hypothetical protein [Allomuricauda aurea]|tara:strand:- start:6917 stop:9091 length:2175 start_codon:yes stop_codon:yes gene_type:complete
MKSVLKTLMFLGPLAIIYILFVHYASPQKIHVYCNESNDLYGVIQKLEHLKVVRYNNLEQLMHGVGPGEPSLILADSYPGERLTFPENFFNLLKERKSRFYVEFADRLPGVVTQPKNETPRYERAVVNSSFFGSSVDSLDILAVNGLTYVPVQVSEAHMVATRVAGLDSAIYGIPESTNPLLFELNGYEGLVSTTGLSNFLKGRYAPQEEWQGVWKGILHYLLGDTLSIDTLEWEPKIRTTYASKESLPEDVRRKSIQRGMAWFQNAKMLVPENYNVILGNHPDKDIKTEFINWSDTIPVGDGSSGVFECIFSRIDETGNQPIGVVVRGDCTGEVAGAFATSGKFLDRRDNYKVANNLLAFYLKESPALKGAYGDPGHGAYGLVPWGISSYAWYKANYGDDNARLFLGAIITTAITGNLEHDNTLMRMLLALYRTTGKNGFRGDRIDLPQLQENGWQHYYDGEVLNLSPHMEAYLWACFLWAYDKTGDPIFLERTKKAIKTTMEGYPDKWKWMNGLAQEKARIILPLAWLVRVEDSYENRKMLYTALDGLLELQDESGAIREELGSIEKGVFPPSKSNADYGLHEASLIAKNGDSVSDLLYTTNFALVGLHEAWYTLKDPKIKAALDQLSEFLFRIQVKSPEHPELDGGWMRAFDFERFEHWGSNADAGWGAWAIESGWTQGWITTILSLRGLDTSIWDLTRQSEIGDHYSQLKKEMLPSTEHR